MNRIFTLIFFFSIIGIHLSQGQYLKMATFASAGGVLPAGNYVSQVVGQSSVISGTALGQGVVFRQGFKQPFGLLKTNKVYQEEENGWSFEIFPNPLVDHLTIRFDQPTANPVLLQVYDIQGKVLWKGDYPEKIKEIYLEKFQNIPAGKYILQVFQKDKSISKSLIKQSN